MRVLGVVLIVVGVVGSAYCWKGAVHDEAYFRAVRALAKYPGNILYTTDLRVAEPRHMLLLAGAYSSAMLGLVLGSLSLGIGSLLAHRSSALR